LKVLEKSLNLNIQYVEIFHFLLITILKQTLVCISPVLAFSLLAYLTKIFTVHYIFFVGCLFAMYKILKHNA